MVYQEDDSRKHFLYVHLFQESHGWDHVLEDCQYDFFYCQLRPENVFLLHGLSFWFCLAVENSCLLKLWIISFSVYIAHFSEDFTRISLLSLQYFDDQHLFKPEELCLICHRFEFPPDKYFCYNIFCYQPIPNNAEFTFINKKKHWKYIFQFSKTISTILNDCLKNTTPCNYV